MSSPGNDYGLWSLAVIDTVVFVGFAYSFFKPANLRDWSATPRFFPSSTARSRHDRSAEWPPGHLSDSPMELFMNAIRLLSIAAAAVLAAASALAADKAPAPAEAASVAKAADCVDTSKMHDHGAERNAARAKSAGCKRDNPALADKNRHDHAKFHKQQ